MNFSQMIQDVRKQFSEDIKNRPQTVFWEALGTVSSLTACITLAIFAHDANLAFVFAAYLIGSIGLVVGAKQRNNSFLILLNIGYTVVNILALINLGVIF